MMKEKVATKVALAREKSVGRLGGNTSPTRKPQKPEPSVPTINVEVEEAAKKYDDLTDKLEILSNALVEQLKAMSEAHAKRAETVKILSSIAKGTPLERVIKFETVDISTQQPVLVEEDPIVGDQKETEEEEEHKEDHPHKEQKNFMQKMMSVRKDESEIDEHHEEGQREKSFFMQKMKQAKKKKADAAEEVKEEPETPVKAPAAEAKKESAIKDRFSFKNKMMDRMKKKNAPDEKDALESGLDETLSKELDSLEKPVKSLVEAKDATVGEEKKEEEAPKKDVEQAENPTKAEEPVKADASVANSTSSAEASADKATEESEEEDEEEEEDETENEESEAASESSDDETEVTSNAEKAINDQEEVIVPAPPKAEVEQPEAAPTPTEAEPPATQKEVETEEEDNKLSYSAIGRDVYTTSVNHLNDYIGDVIKYCEDWRRVNKTRIRAGMFEFEDLTEKLEHYEGKVKGLEKAKSKDKQERNEMKLLGVRESHATFGLKLLKYIEEVTDRGWKDLYPLLLNLMQFDVGYAAGQFMSVADLNRVIDELKGIGEEYGLKPEGRLQDLATEPLGDVYTGKRKGRKFSISAD